MSATDQELLQRYAASHDEAAFTALVERHAALVFGACRRVLGNVADAEDASQAVFLILAKKAGSIDASATVAPWLHRVAIDMARNTLKARRTRERHHREVAAMPRTADAAIDFGDDLDAALNELPARERSAIILFHLQGRTVAEVAGLISKPEGTICVWLHRGRERLAQALRRRGLALPATVLLAGLGSLQASEVPVGFTAATVKAAGVFCATGVATTPAATLALKGYQAMKIVAAIKSAAIAATVTAVLGTAGLVVAVESTAKSPANPPVANAQLLGSPAFTPSPERPVGWRGDGTGRYPGATPPTTWSRKHSGAGYEAKGIVWATPLPDVAVASPIVVGKHIFVTAENTDLVCIDKESGRIQWIRSNPEFEGMSEEERKADPGYEKLAALLPSLAKANADTVEQLNAMQANAITSGTQPSGGAWAKKREIEKQIWDQQLAIYKKSGYQRYGTQGVFGYSGQTPSSDGKRVYVFLATGVSVAYDLEGNRTWIHHKPGGGPEHGNFTSPLLGENRFAVWAGGEMRGFEADTGKLLWTTPTQGMYGSLFRVQAGDGQVAGTPLGCFVRLRDGKLVWGDAGFGTGMPTPIVEGGMVLGYSDQNNRGSRTFKIPASTETGKVELLKALKADWGGDLTDKNFARTLVASSLYVDGLIYSLTEGGGLLVNNATSGEVVYRKVLAMKPRTSYWEWAGASASPTLAGKYLYLMDNQGTTVVIQPGPEYKDVAVNLLEESKSNKEQAQTLTTPVFEGTRMYYRSPGYLYCIGEK